LNLSGYSKPFSGKLMQILKKYCAYILAAIFSWNLWLPTALAQIKISDSFTAQTNCPAVQSIRQGNNPGNIELTPGQTYSVIGKNKADASYYLLNIDGAQPAERWVSKQCGQLLSAANPGDPTAPANGAPGQKYVLALSWQPAFCETHQAKSECQTGTSSRFDATNLTLHGLWPQPNGNFFCGVSRDIKAAANDKRWDELPPITLSAATTKALSEKMPGFASNLQVYEWYKHGTCYGTSPEQYFQDAMRLQDQVNSSSVQKLFAENIGNEITSADIRSSFDSSFGAGSGNKIAIECGKSRPRLITELQINLAGEIKPNTSIASLISAASGRGGNSCPKGEVDRVGFN
jgi:ribonuclease T2